MIQGHTVKRGVVLVVLMGVAQLATGETSAQAPPIREEREVMLSALPNGVSVVPDCDRHLTSLFSFKYGQLRRIPFEDDPTSAEEFHRVVMRKQTGDILYDEAEGGSLVAITLQMLSLGEGTLSEAVVPEKPQWAETRWLPARVGEVYLLKTTDGNMALFRILLRTKDVMKIQWIYQPAETASFALKGSFLDRKVGDISIDHNLEATLGRVRGRGIRMCIEFVERDESLREHRLLSVKDATVRAAVEGLVKTWPVYDWEHIQGTNIIWLYPRGGSVLDFAPDLSKVKLPVKDTSMKEIVQGLGLRERKIIYPFRGMGPLGPPLPDKKITADIRQGQSARAILAAVCWAYGDDLVCHVYQAAGYPAGTKRLSFVRMPLLSYRPAVRLLDTRGDGEGPSNGEQN